LTCVVRESRAMVIVWTISELGDARFEEINKNADTSFGLPQLV